MNDGSKKILSVAPAAVGAAVVVILVLWYAHYSAIDKAGSDIYMVSGKAIHVALSNRTITLKDQDDQLFTVTVLPETLVLNEKGDATVFSYIQTGFTVRITGTVIHEQSFVPFEVRVIKR